MDLFWFFLAQVPIMPTVGSVPGSLYHTISFGLCGHAFALYADGWLCPGHVTNLYIFLNWWGVKLTPASVHSNY